VQQHAGPRTEGGAFALIRRYAACGELDLALNPILMDTGIEDLVPIGNVLNTANVQQHCSPACRTVRTGAMRKDLRSLKVPFAKVVHDPNECRYALNKLVLS
jgi:hypothetical protein